MSENEPKHGITIFEFKRPMRDDEDPIEQMIKYIRKIREGKARTNKGRFIEVNNSTPFFCYAICDLSQPLREKFSSRGMISTPDNDGFFWFNQNYNAYFEVISYTKLLRDSMQRNAILFEKLNIK